MNWILALIVGALVGAVAVGTVSVKLTVNRTKEDPGQDKADD